jgi:hypothetical protein
VERGITEDVVFHIGEFVGSAADVGLGRRALHTRRGGVLALARGDIRHLALGALAVIRGENRAGAAGVVVARPLANRRRGVALALASYRYSFVVDRPTVAFGAVTSQTLPHRQSRLALDDRFTDRLADRLTVALADKADRLAIGRAFLAVWLAILPVA